MYKIVAGVDEAGRGPLAGPVVAGAVIINNHYIIDRIKDSKKLSPKKREHLYELITQNYEWGIGIVEHDEIDRINILEATKQACIIAVNALPSKPEIILVDGNMKFTDARFCSIINGDNLHYEISAASIIAKVTRDRIMMRLAEEFPEYLWNKNSGYGTKEHFEAIDIYGISMYHRRSFLTSYLKSS